MPTSERVPFLRPALEDGQNFMLGNQPVAPLTPGAPPSGNV
jgi:hypothetical protein